MSSDLLDSEVTRYQVSVIFHGAEDGEFYYLVDGPSKEDAKKHAIEMASNDLSTFGVTSVGDGTYEVLVNFHKFKRASIRLVTLASNKDEACKLALKLARDFFTTTIIFSESC